MKKRFDFYFVELLIILTIVAIILAILIPNLIDTYHRWQALR